MENSLAPLQPFATPEKAPSDVTGLRSEVVYLPLHQHEPFGLGLSFQVKNGALCSHSQYMRQISGVEYPSDGGPWIVQLP